MIPNTGVREVESNGVTATREFGISLKDSAHIMTILRDTLYSDKVLAVLREYSANAWDAHREAGKRDVPIKVTIPTAMDPTLTIQDFGPGLSHEAVFEVYTQYGASTKRGNDDSVGMLGIGSKSGFAYSDSFTITSRHGGMKRTYVAVLDESEKGAINLLHEEACGDETGVQIQIPVKTVDISEFVQKARKLFQYFVPRPVINIDLPPQQQGLAVLANGTVAEGTGEWVAVMGCVPYRVNTEQLRVKNHADGDDGIAQYVSKISGALYFNIGEVQVSASREELKYSTATKTVLVEKFNTLIQEYIQHTLTTLETGGFSPWEKRLRAQVLTRLGLPIPATCKAIVQESIRLKGVPVCFTLTRGGPPVVTINIRRTSRLLLRNDDRALAGFELGEDDYLICPADNVSWPTIQRELDDVLEELGLTGITIQNLSEITWTAPPTRSRGGKQVNRKHRVKTFRLETNPALFTRPWSEAWAIEERTPEADDLFVILSGFQSHGLNIYSLFRRDAALAKHFGGQVPPVYGYKSTEKRPVKAEDCVGTPYETWHKAFAQTLLTPKIEHLITELEWSETATEYAYWKYGKKRFNDTSKALGDGHIISSFSQRQQKARTLIKGKADGFPEALTDLRNRIRPAGFKSEAKRIYEDINATYPLFTLPEIKLDALFGDHAEKWTEYVKLVDSSRASTTGDSGAEATALHHHS